MRLRAQARHRKPGPAGYFLAAAFSAAALLTVLISASWNSPAADPPASSARVTAASTGTDVLSLIRQLIRQDTAAIHAASVRSASARAVRAKPAAPARYAVRPGDTLSSVARKLCGTARDWTGIYAASRAQGLTARNANDITAGQQLAVSCRYVPSMLGRAWTPPPPPPPPPPAPAPAPVQAAAADADSYQAPAYQAPAYQAPAATVSVSSYSGFQQCVIARESGGNSQVMNSTGHYGLYQFSLPTWEAYGGSAASFGNASVAQQNAVFANAMAAGGESNWAPYDGC